MSPHGPEPSAPCPSVSAYKRHLRHGETPCDECKAKWAEQQRIYYHARKART